MNTWTLFAPPPSICKMKSVYWLWSPRKKKKKKTNRFLSVSIIVFSFWTKSVSLYKNFNFWVCGIALNKNMPKRQTAIFIILSATWKIKKRWIAAMVDGSLGDKWKIGIKSKSYNSLRITRGNLYPTFIFKLAVIAFFICKEVSYSFNVTQFIFFFFSFRCFFSSTILLFVSRKMCTSTFISAFHFHLKLKDA